MNKRNLRMIEPEIDTENMEISFSAASQEPYDRGWCIEILNCKPESVDLSRLNNGAAILKNHNDDQILGKVIKAWTENDRLYVRARFCKNNDDAVRVFKDICDGTLQNVSVGYIQDEFIDRQLDNSRVERTVTRWTCLEVSVAVGVPADPTVGFYRKMKSKSQLITQNKGTENMHENETNEMAEIEALKGELETLKSELETLKENSVGAETENETEQKKKSMKKEIRSLNVRTAAPANAQAYDIARAFKAALGMPGCELERRVSDEMYRSAGLAVKGGNAIMLSTRDLTAANAPGLIATDHLADQFVEKIATKMALKNATVISGLVGNATIPAQTGDTNVQNVAVNDALTGSDPAIGSITLSPRKFGGMVKIGKDLLAQGNPSVVNFVINDLTKKIARQLEAYAYNKIAENASVQKADFAEIAKPTWKETTNIVGLVEDLEVGSDLSWIMKGATKANFKQASKDAGSGRFICEDNEIDGFGVDVSGQCPADTVFFGAFENIVFGEWGGLEIVIDQFTLADQGAVRVIGTLLADVAVRNPEAFVVATNATE